ncbi:hypothetical protein ACN47E_008820 [Coniothyrium glycines]
MRAPLRPQWLTFRPLRPWHPRAPAPTTVPRCIATTDAANAAPIDLPKLVLSPGSSRHNSLPSFLEYAERTKLAPETTLYVGTHYEYVTARALMRLGFSLLRVGRRADAGIDLIGHWVLGPLREPLPVIVQCKVRKTSLGPSHVRELEGSFQNTPADWRRRDVLGLLITTFKATKGMLDALGQSRWPIGFVLVTKSGLVQQFVWNRAAAERGLEGVGVTVRHTPRAMLSDAEVETVDEELPQLARKRLTKFKHAGTRKDIQLTWMGSPIFPERQDIAKETERLFRDIDLDNETPRHVTLYKIVKQVEGRPRTAHLDPSPRGGVVGERKRGKGFAGNTPESVIVLPPTKCGDDAPTTIDDMPAPKRGRPIGSKNKSKVLRAE